MPVFADQHLGTETDKATKPASTSSAQPASSTSSLSSQDELTSAQPMKLSKLMETKVKSKSGEDLGELEDLLINPQTGKVDYAVLGRGGFLGIGEKLVPVPWKAFSVNTTGDEFTLNIDKDQLKSAPTTDKEYSNVSDPGYTVTIYRFFSIPMDVGGAETPGGVDRGGSELHSDSESQVHEHDEDKDEDEADTEAIEPQSSPSEDR